MAHLVGGCATEVVSSGSGAVNPYELIAAYDAVSGCISSWELSVTEESTPEVTHPEIHVFIRRPGVRSALAGELDRIAGTESSRGGRDAENAR